MSWQHSIAFDTYPKESSKLIPQDAKLVVDTLLNQVVIHPRASSCTPQMTPPPLVQDLTRYVMVPSSVCVWGGGGGHQPSSTNTTMSVLQDPDRGCRAVDCAVKYRGQRNFYRNSTGRCERVVHCNTRGKDGVSVVAVSNWLHLPQSPEHTSLHTVTCTHSLNIAPQISIVCHQIHLGQYQEMYTMHVPLAC